MHSTYKRMILRMQEKEKQFGVREAADDLWVLYMLRCCDGSLYTGITKDLERRFKMHETGKASRYTRTRRPIGLCYQEPCGTRAQALVRECEVKAYSKKQKESLILGVGSRRRLKARKLSKKRLKSPRGRDCRAGTTIGVKPQTPAG